MLERGISVLLTLISDVVVWWLLPHREEFKQIFKGAVATLPGDAPETGITDKSSWHSFRRRQNRCLPVDILRNVRLL